MPYAATRPGGGSRVHDPHDLPVMTPEAVLLRQLISFNEPAAPIAIPAVFGYNLFANRLTRMDGELEGFGTELIALLVREGRI